MRSIGYPSRLVSAPGAANSGDMVSVSMPEGHARGIVIDNPSGSWLSVSSLYDLVPPYVLQWSRDLPVGAASVTIRYIDGPAGQVSTQDGDPFTVWLDTELVGASNGISTPGKSFIQGFTPQFSASLSVPLEVSISTTFTTLLAGITGSRFRIKTIVAALWLDNATAMAKDSTARWLIRPNPIPTPPYPSLEGVLTPFSFPTDFRSLGDGLDWPVGAAVEFGGASLWPQNAHTEIDCTITYEVI